MEYDLALGGDDDLAAILGGDFEGDFEGDNFEGDEFGGRGSRRKAKTRYLRQAMPFPRTSVAAGVTTTVTAFPQRKMVLERFVFAASVAGSFTVDELKVGQESMLINTGNIPAELFSQTGVGMALSGYVANVGSTVSLTCTNTSAGALFISAAIVGHVKVRN